MGSVLLPALSWTGYPVWSFEYLTVAAISMVLTLAVFHAARPSWLVAAITLALSWLAFGIYFAGRVLESYLVASIILAAGFALTAAGAYRTRAALIVAGCAGLAQIVLAAVATPSAIKSESRHAVLPSDVPAVIHILLDAHAGIAAMPPEAIPPASRDALEASYLDLGFTVFRRAYTADVSTPMSVARLFNPDHPDPFKTLRGRERPGWWQLHTAAALEAIASRRVLNLISIDYTSLHEVAARLPNVASNIRYDHFATFAGVAPYGLPLDDRLWLMASVVVEWMRASAKSPLVIWALRETPFGRWMATNVLYLRSAPPLISMRVLNELIQRMQCCIQHSSYTFVHLLLPRDPFILRADCSPRPAREWLVHRIFQPGQADTADSRLERYRLHFEQAQCVARMMSRLVAAIDSRPELKGSTIILHGDHGSRIVTADRKQPPGPTSDDRQAERDWRGTLLAIRIHSHLSSKVIETPVRVDQVFKTLVENDFREVPLEALGPLEDSPY
jgi:hypothetical protein